MEHTMRCLQHTLNYGSGQALGTGDSTWLSFSAVYGLLEEVSWERKLKKLQIVENI